MTIAAAMIVRDEAAFLVDCLASLRDRVDEIVIVDTGSSDATVDIAVGAGGYLLHFDWQGDFAAARNVALDAVSCDWVLYIDADERLGLPAGGALEDYIDPTAVAAYVRFQPRLGYTRYRELRLFRSDPRIRFSGRIHETVVPAIRALEALDGRTVARTAVEINHLGYEGDQSHKHARNLALLQASVRADPDRAYCWYHLAETLDAIGRREEGIAAANAGIASTERLDSEQQRGAASLIHQYLARVMLEQGNDVTDMIALALKRFPEDHALRFLHGRMLIESRRPIEALEIAIALRAVDPDALGDGLLAFDRAIFGEKACELAALACFQLGDRQGAADHFLMASRLAPHDPSYRIRAIALGDDRAARPVSFRD
ncbi:hypothetical protein C3941_04405 [Kaistia algarum]|uniref:glycosyltransferase family 2 protein n=1 Tax=Kaistia algarum TaxID=2083279 RepID=UPI000CE86B36|nr:glycosyltransferase family 2 protein [Kaistia algarum]MCX5512540.1 glycosyltransferase family 2 protein [Kaistia algarum]PPE81932.1 hypothetical protein C3941_04405 [Kaistia algarum]